MSSPVLLSPGQAHLHPCLLDKLHCSVQSRCGVHSPKGCSLQGDEPALLLSQPRGWLTLAFTIRDSSLCCLGESAGPASLSVSTSERSRLSSSALMPQGPSLPTTKGDKEEKGHHPQTYTTLGQLNGRASPTVLSLLGPTHLYHHHQNQVSCPSKAQGLLSQVL